jgi:DNA-binding winged helix-turn-helix (wHTH) protein
MSGLLRFSGFELDLERQELRRGGRRVALAQQPFRALVLLATRAGQVVTREELRHALWPDGTHVDFERGINFCLNQVRTALRDPARASHFVETLPRIGYRFVADVHTVGTEPGPAVAAAEAAPPERRRPWWAIAAVLALAGTTSSLVRPRPPAPHDAAAQADYVRGLALLQRPDADAWARAADALGAATVREPAHADAQAALARVLLGLADAGRLPPRRRWTRARRAGTRGAARGPAPGGRARQPRSRAAPVSTGTGAPRTTSTARRPSHPTWPAPTARRRRSCPPAARTSPRSAPPRARPRSTPCARRSAATSAGTSTARGASRRRPSSGASRSRSTGDSGPRDRLVDAYRHERRTDDAWREAATVLRGVGVPAAHIEALARRGPEEAVRGSWQAAPTTSRAAGAPLERLAALYAAAGADERAEALLRRAADERSPGLLAALAVDPDFERLRGRPAYEELLRATGLGAARRRFRSALLIPPHRAY